MNGVGGQLWTTVYSLFGRKMVKLKLDMMDGFILAERVGLAYSTSL